MTLHDTQELHDDLGARADEHLALSTALGIDNVVEAVVLVVIYVSINIRK